jgi:DNA-binding response OmpR family regulator
MNQQPRVLAVDDESLIRMSLAIALTREGYTVETAASGLEAMELLEKNRYDLVLLDLRLPDVSGMEVLRYARRLDPTVKVLLVTASSNAPTLSEARNQGAAGVVTKPFALRHHTEETRRLVSSARLDH